jgi:hypothetical protein
VEWRIDEDEDGEIVVGPTVTTLEVVEEATNLEEELFKVEDSQSSHCMEKEDLLVGLPGRPPDLEVVCVVVASTFFVVDELVEKVEVLLVRVTEGELNVLVLSQSCQAPESDLVGLAEPLCGLPDALVLDVPGKLTWGPVGLEVEP